MEENSRNNRSGISCNVSSRYQYLQERIEKEEPFNIAISSISVAELENGVSKSAFPERNKIALLEFLSPFEIIPFTHLDCDNFGALRAHLEKKVTPIGPYDLQIASQCLSRSLILVSNNIKEFKRVPNLKYENWIQT